MKEPEPDISGTTAVTGNATETTTSTVALGTAVSIDADYYGWLHDQASVLRRLRPSALDWRNLAEELEAMGRGEENALESYLMVLLKHLLKWRYQPMKRTGSWEASIENSWDHIDDLLKRSPSLKSKIDQVFNVAYRHARRGDGPRQSSMGTELTRFL